jgi:hypothetical protein
MSNPRLSIDKLRQIIQFESSELSAREVGRASNVSHGAVAKCRCAVRAAGVSWEEAQHLDDAELERRIWQTRAARTTRAVVLPDCAWIQTELKRHKRVTLQLLWDEYHATHGMLALRYSSFCERYRHWVRRLQRSMRQRHYAGEKLFCDCAGSSEWLQMPLVHLTSPQPWR